MVWYSFLAFGPRTSLIIKAKTIGASVCQKIAPILNRTVFFRSAGKLLELKNLIKCCSPTYLLPENPRRIL